MATLFVDKVDPQSGTSLEIGSSGDTITIPSGATITNNGTQTGFGGANTPAFQAKSSASQTVSSDSFAKITCNTEEFDTAGAYDNSTNYRFTVPSGQAGKYYVYGLITANGLTNANLDSANCSIYKNGSSVGGLEFYMHGNPTARYIPVIEFKILDLSVGDYVELYGRIETDNGNDGKIGGTFGAYKIIE
jgi:hypothetical protein